MPSNARSFVHRFHVLRRRTQNCLMLKGHQRGLDMEIVCWGQDKRPAIFPAYSAGHEVDEKPVLLFYSPFCRVAASPYPAYKINKYQ